jgi:ADP-ribose pyrophosphatase
MDRRDVESIKQTTVFQGYFRVDKYRLRHRLFEGGMSRPIEREVFERGHAVGALPYDPMLDEVVLIEQFRIGPYACGEEPWQIEIVAGIIDSGEIAEDVVRRELLEEAGLRSAHALIPIGKHYTSPGASTETLQMYCAIVDAAAAGGVHGLVEEGEDIRVSRASFASALQWLNEGRITSGPAIIALQWLALHRQVLRAKFTNPESC